MQEYIIKGTIITEQISTHNIEAGTICLIKKDETYHRITIMHIDKDGNWVVEGDYDGPLNKEKPLYRLSVLTTNHCFPIGFKDWKRIINASMIGLGNQSFLIKPKVFREGKNVQTCSECNCTFLATKNQPFCKNCCHKLSIAYLQGDTAAKAVEKLFKESIVVDLCGACYTMGKTTMKTDEFNKWLKDKLNGDNSSKKTTT